MATFQCSCGARYRLADKLAGRRARCKKCGQAFTVPGAGDEDVIPFALEELATGEAVERPPSAAPPSPAPAAAGDVQHDRPRRESFWRDLPRMLSFPRNTSEVWTLLGVTMALVISAFAAGRRWRWAASRAG